MKKLITPIILIERNIMFIKLPNPRKTIKTIVTVALTLGGVVTSTAAQAIQLNITYAPGTTLEQRTSVEMAKNIVSSYLTKTDATVNIHVAMNKSMSTNYLALATPAMDTTKSYGVFTQAAGLSSLNLTSYKMLKQDGTTATGNILMITRANSKALDIKLRDIKIYNGLDGYIQFNNNVSWVYNYNQNTPTNKYDMTSIAMHEIFHVLGIVSGIDPSNIKTPYPTTMDLFRYSTESLLKGAIDFRQGSNSYLANNFSGVFSGNYLSKGVNTSLGGDGYQTSHWRNNPGSPTGIMNPTQYAGQKLAPSSSDLVMLGLIGYTVNTDTPNVTTLYSQAQSQANSATIIDQTDAVTQMIADSGVYGTEGSGGSGGSGWWERAAQNHNDHDH